MSLPKVIFGTSGFGNLYAIMPDEVKCAIVANCIEMTKTPFFDTAGKYGAGLALESIGHCLKQLNVDRDKILISNKLGWYSTALLTEEPTFEPGVWKGLKYDAVQKISYEGILECYEQGNDLLGNYNTNYVSVHDPDEYLASGSDAADREKRYKDILGAYDALSELKRSGKVSAIGVGAKDWTSIARIDQDIRLDWVMIANSMTIHHHPKPLLDFMRKLEKQGTVIINSAVFNGGFLTGGDYYNYSKIEIETSSGMQLFNWRDKFNRLCNLFGVSPAAVAVKFGLAAPGVKSVALSSSSPSRVAANLDLVKTRIPSELWLTAYDQQLITADGLDMILYAENLN